MASATEGRCCGNRLRENRRTSEPFLNASSRIPSNLRSKIHSGPVNRSWVSVAAIGSIQSGKKGRMAAEEAEDAEDADEPLRPRNGSYRAEQGVGFQPAALGSFLKSVVVTYCRAKYWGSSTFVVTVSH